MTTLSLCMIVRDEAESIRASLVHHRELVDEMVVVDTGSTDGTPTEARRGGARVESIAWPDDFAAARNVSLARARGDWILVLDADERLEANHFTRVRAAVASGDADAYTLAVRTYTSDCEFFLWQPLTEPIPGAEAFAGYYVTRPLRLFRRHPDVRFRGIIHESVTDALADAGFSWRPLEVVVHHFNAAKPEPVKAEKHRRYLALSRTKADQQPGDAQAQAELGFTALACRDLALAIVALRRAVALAPERVLYADFLGAALLQARDWQGAAAWYGQAIDRFPRQASLHFGLGKALTELGRMAEAAAALGRCLDLAPLHAPASVTLGVVEMQQGHDAEALACFERARDVNPRYDLPDLNLGILRDRQGRPADGRVHFRRAIALNPARWESFVAMGDSYFKAGDYDAAARWYEGAAGVQGHAAAVYVKRCSAEVARRNFALARQLARTAARLDPRYAQVEAMVPAD